MSKDDCIGGGNVLHTTAISDIKELGHCFVGNVPQHSSRTPVHAPAPGLATLAATLPQVPSVMEQRRLARSAAAGHRRSSSYGAQGGRYNL